MAAFDTDYLIIGSGFGGSVSALRLAQKGYRVLVVEQGRRFAPRDMPESTRNLRRFLWLPSLFCRGFFSLRLFRHMLVLHGNAVGGGSVVYANTLLVPPEKVWRSGTWALLRDWAAEMPEHYRTAEKMLGVTTNPLLADADHMLKKLADEAGVGGSFYRTRVAVYFGADDEHAQPQQQGDPYFAGQGPARAPCVGCGGCMVGCRYRAKNTLDYNYLYLAERQGAQVLVWVVGLTAATVAIGRYSDGHRNQAKLWCGLAVLLAAWVAWQGFGDGRWLVVAVLLAQVVLSLRLLKLPHLRY